MKGTFKIFGCILGTIAVTLLVMGCKEEVHRAVPDPLQQDYHTDTQMEEVQETPAPVVEPERMTVVLLDSGRQLECENVHSSECGINMTGCTDKCNYYCIGNVQVPTE